MPSPKDNSVSDSLTASQDRAWNRCGLMVPLVLSELLYCNTVVLDAEELVIYFTPVLGLRWWSFCCHSLADHHTAGTVVCMSVSHLSSSLGSHPDDSILSFIPPQAPSVNTTWTDRFLHHLIPHSEDSSAMHTALGTPSGLSPAIARAYLCPGVGRVLAGGARAF